MTSLIRFGVAVALFSSPAAILRAQTPADASGHWQGSVSGQGVELRFELDLQKNSRGEYVGTVDIPGERITGLPLRQVIVQGSAIEFNARTDQGFRGDIAADGQSMSGTFSAEGAALPFYVTRTGSARVHPTKKGARITSALEGEWNATMAAQGGMRIVLKMANDLEGGSTAVLINMDEGGLHIPGTILQQGPNVTIDLAPIGGAYSGTLSDDGMELIGKYSQGERSIGVTFRRATRAPGPDDERSDVP